MSFASAVKAFFESEKPAIESATSQLAHPSLASTRLWVTIGFGAALIWLAKGVLTDLNMILLASTVNIYLICNTITRCIQLKASAKSIVTDVKSV